MAHDIEVFTSILDVTVPVGLVCNEQTQKNNAFEISIQADGVIPFPQVILRGNFGQEIINGDAIALNSGNRYTAKIPESIISKGVSQLQVEGCRKESISQAGGDDWIKYFGEINMQAAPQQKKKSSMSKSSSSKIKIYFGIHKHMHQPYYDAANTNYWDGEKDGIFGERTGAYSNYIPAAIDRYVDGDLPYGGLSVSWSGTLIEQLNRCDAEGLAGGGFKDWSKRLAEVAQTEKTEGGNPRLDFSSFGFFHPLMSLIPERNIVRQIEMHKAIIKETFGVDSSSILFPPETAFHVRMIPALNKAGVKAVIYDSIHRYRASVDYPYSGKDEGLLPPNPSEQENEGSGDWLGLNNIWAPGKVSPSSLRPEYIKYIDPEGKEHCTIGIPAERYIGNEDGRGGFGALQYPDVLGQIYNSVAENGDYDEKHPPFFLIHSDGDNFGGGADSYYYNNTEQLVQWLQDDPRFELMTANDYLDQFPPDPKKAIHVEPGSWAGADNGDPQFKKWFSRYDQPYSPDLNSWAVLTALQNIVHTAEDSGLSADLVDQATRLMLTAETSCYWYWTGQDEWDKQVTNAANSACSILSSHIDGLKNSDKTPPTIFAPWVYPENPGGKEWGNNCLNDASHESQLSTFVYDICGLKSVQVVIISKEGETTYDMVDNDLYPTQTSPNRTANYFTFDLPVSAGDIRYYIIAEDKNGNISKSALERIYLA